MRAAVPEADVLVADDNSPDGTGELADELAADRRRTSTCCTAPGKEGLGAAYLAGFRWGLERGYDVLVEMDADGSHQPEQLPRLLDALQRRRPGARARAGCPAAGSSTGRSRRELLSRGGNIYARLALGLPLRDITGGYRAFRARRRCAGLGLDDVAVARATASRSTSPGARSRPGYRVVEVPITFVERERGDSQDEPRHRRARRCWRVTVWGAKDKADRARRAVRRARTPVGGGLVT